MIGDGCEHYNIEVIEQVDERTVLRICPDCGFQTYDPIPGEWRE